MNNIENTLTQLGGAIDDILGTKPSDVRLYLNDLTVRAAAAGIQNHRSMRIRDLERMLTQKEGSRK